MKVELQPIREWSKNNPEDDSLRVYCGRLLCGIATPIIGEDKYRFETGLDIMNVSPSPKTLEMIKYQVELSLKEFLVKICK